MGDRGGERGQASPEWVGLIAVVAVTIAGLLAVAPARRAATELAGEIAGTILCGVSHSAGCGPHDDDELVAGYGAEVALLLRSHAPTLMYEGGMRALPVDFRRCLRDAGCADGAGAGEVLESRSGLPVTAFTRVVDRRGEDGYLYLQYWFYYANSATGRGSIPGVSTAIETVGDVVHGDDWESYQVRIDRAGDAEARASSHHGYNHGAGPRNWVSDTAGGRPAWGPVSGYLFVSGGSHAGHVAASRPRGRFTPGERLRLVPAEPLRARPDMPDFEVSPPWAKAVWSDPAHNGT